MLHAHQTPLKGDKIGIVFGSFASVYLDGTWQRIKIKQWCDYEGDQIQITTPNGAVYLFHASNCTLIHKP
jgi:hypothetical protein